MQIGSNKIEELKSYLATPQRIVILAHTNPDGDAVGSSLAWAEILEKQGHSVTCIVPNRFPYYLEFMPGCQNIVIHKGDKEGRAEAAVRSADIIFCLDFHTMTRLDGLGDVIDHNQHAKRILIDHHLDPTEDFDLMISYPVASSTCYLVALLVEQLYGAEHISRTMAENLFVGMMTDTGNFAFSSVTPDVFRMVAVLAEKGISIPDIHNHVYNSFTEGRARLFGYVINRKMKIFHNGSVAHMSLTADELRRFWFQQGDSEGFVNYPLTIKKMKISAMFTEHTDFIRVSLRSRADIDVNIFAQRYFHGGGHKNAAGGKSFVSMEETLKHFERCIKEYAAEGRL
ncbi:MAG: bifunctional oligoribonuclease/PAP phosphatase NrnA [Alistipes sp.]|uniref:DHH family phosphoesterase n=1 Tax=Alistipes sp. TaxID=1872444 RepID=UPI001B7391AE|nr:bifunctional oligoribonuclease/PAP phosphatase NrnA [Alistipes sp.]